VWIRVLMLANLAFQASFFFAVMMAMMVLKAFQASFFFRSGSWSGMGSNLYPLNLA
jgi:hypothetical protein